MHNQPLNIYNLKVAEIISPADVARIGTEEYNLSLGVRRADAVKDYLIRAGVAESRLSTISYGESRLAHDNSREVTRRLNRRGHLRVLVTASR